MYEALLVVIGVAVALVVLAAVFYLSQKPRRLGRRRWLASASGERDDPTKHWPGDPNSMP